MEFKAKVKAVRGQLFITQAELSKELGCSSVTINRWEKGVKSPSFILEQKFKKFCKDKGINLDTLEGIE